MSETYEQHLFIPGLLDNLSIWQRDFDFSPSAPKLVKSLSSMSLGSSADIGMLPSIYSLLESHVGSSDQNARSHARACYQFDFPEAGGDVSGKQAVLCADPIELEAGMNDIAVGHRLVDDLTSEENQVLAKALNQHFSQDDWQFVVSDFGRWYLLLSEDQKPKDTIPVEQVLGQSLRSLIEGMEDVRWSRQINELQMLLYSSQVNQSRENQRLRTVSSFWMWDVTATPNRRSVKTAFDARFDARFIKGGGYQGEAIAKQYGLDYKDFDGVVNTQASGLYIYTGLMEPARFNNLEVWQQQLTELEEFVEDLHRGVSANITINSCNGYTWRMGGKSFWNIFNRRKQSLLDFL